MGTGHDQLYADLMRGKPDPFGVVYLLYFPAGRCGYVGASFDVSSRWRSHLKKLRQRKHPNEKLQAAFDRWGEPGMWFKMLVVVPNARPADLASAETRMIRKLAEKGPGAVLNLATDGHASDFRKCSYILETVATESGL